MPEAARKIVPDQGWSWVVLVAAFFCNITFDGIIYSFGVLYLDLLDEFGESKGHTSWIGSVISGVYAIVGPLASVLANRFGCRAMTIIGAFISSAGFILCTFSPNIWVMIVTYGIMGGIGFGFMYLCAYVMIGHFFDKRRALATGIASCGSGVGTFIFAPMVSYLIRKYTWTGAMWILAGIVLNGVVCGAVFRGIPRRRNDDGTKVKRQLIDFSLLKTPVFLILCTSSFLCMIGFFVPFIYLIDYARHIGIEPKQGAYLLSIIGISNTGARVLCGYISDKSWADPLKIYNWALIIGGVSTISSAWLSSYALLSCYAVVFGLCVAAYVSLTAILLVEFLGLERLSNSFGFLNMFRGVATFIGAPLAGFFFDLTGNYHLAFCTAGVAIASAGIICLPLRYLHKCENIQQSIEQAEKILDMTAERAHTDQSSKSVPNLRTQALLRDAKLVSSTALLTGSHGFIGLPNPYLNYDSASSTDGDVSASHDNLYVKARGGRLGQLTLSQSESALPIAVKQHKPS